MKKCIDCFGCSLHSGRCFCDRNEFYNIPLREAKQYKPEDFHCDCWESNEINEFYAYNN
jgi:hypothetical protein